MKRYSILVLLIVIFLMAKPTFGSLTVSMRGDDDGFGTGSPVVPGDLIANPGTADPDGFDVFMWGTLSSPDFEWTHNFIPFSNITSATLYVQYIDFPESGDGEFFVDGLMTTMSFPTLYPWDSSPYTVLGKEFDLSSYFVTLMDGSVTFGLDAHNDDAYCIDYAKLTIEGTLIPAPGALILSSIGVSLLAGVRRKNIL